MLKEHFLFEKDFFKTVFAITLPIAMQNVISFGVNAMDSIMLGSLGDIAVSGANLGGQPFFLMSMAGFGLAGGGNVLISQYWGKGDREVIRKVMRISMLAVTVIALLAGIVCFFFPYQVMSLYTNEAEVQVAAAGYLKVISIGFVFYAIANNYMSSLRAVENVKMSTIVYGMSFFVNVFFNYIFIFGKFGAPKMGVVGAAMGTLFARVFEFVCITVYMYFIEKNIEYKMHCMFKLDSALIPDFVRHALPVVGNEMIWGLGATATSMIMGRIGSTFVAANSITNVIAQLAQVFIFGISNAAAVVCGKTIGEGKRERAQKTAQTLMLMGVVFGLISSVMILALRTPFLSIYDITPQAKEAAYGMMLVLALIQPIAAIDIISIVGILRGGGDTKLGLALDGCGMWLCNIPMGILTGLVLKIPPRLIFLAMRSDSFIKIFIEIKRITSGVWIRTVTRDDL
ncbi:MAG: MATE family efflux transporter [Oscillospiraceae bacterium]|nr:MATE family efflux transporter [Oscillospiraceae bacterium]